MININKYWIFAIIISLLFFSCNENNKTQETEIQTSLAKLKNKNYSEAWLVISPGLSDNFIQFFVNKNEVYFDFPIYSEIKNKYKDERFDGKIDSLSKSSFFTKYLTNSQIFNLKKLLNKYNLDFYEVRLGFIEPTITNQTDTTGWVTSIRGDFKIDFSQSKKFIDEYFLQVYKIKTDSITYSIEEN